MIKDYPFPSSNWIWSNDSPENVNQYALFRKTVQLSEVGGEARVHACADMRYWLYVNGERVGFGPGKYNERFPQYDSHDVTRRMKPGRNVVAFKVHGIGAVEGCSSFMPVRCGLIAAVELNGQIIGTDGSWRSINDDAYRRDTPRFCNHQSFIECFDARKRIKDWETETYDDSSWGKAWEIPENDLAPWEKLVPKNIDHLTLTPRFPTKILEFGRSKFATEQDLDDLTTLGEALEGADRYPEDGLVEISNNLFPLLIQSPRNSDDGGYVVMDFGGNSAGYPVLDLEGTPGVIVDLAYGESFDGKRFECAKQGARYHDRVVLGTERFEHQLMFPKCFRYLLIEARRGHVTLHGSRHDVSAYPVRWRGGFVSPDDERLRRVWQIGAHTVQMCMEDVYMDTPRRERAGWLGDMLPEAMAAYHAFGETKVARHSLELFMSSQTQEGWISGRYPGLGDANMPVWSAIYNMALADYARHSGDLELVEKVWSGVGRLTRWFERQRAEEGLMVVSPAKANEGTRGYILVDWAPMEREGAISAMNMFYYQYLREGQWLAERIGKDDDARALADLAERTKKAIQNLLFDERRGVFVNCRNKGLLSEQAGCQENLLAILWDIATPSQAERVMSALSLDDAPLPLWRNPDPRNWRELGSGDVPWEGEGLVPMGSPFFAYFALDAMFAVGKTTAALNNIRAHYGDLLAVGATTVWEEWSGVSSQSHGWGAGPTSLLPRRVLGVKPVEPGFRMFEVLPSFGDLRQAGGRIPTPKGVIQVEWKRRGDGSELSLRVPEGLSARAGLPVVKNGKIMVCDGEKRQGGIVVTRRGKYLVSDVGPGEHTLKMEV